MTILVDITGSLGQKIRHENLRLVGHTADFNPGLDGREQVLFTENRVWQGKITFPPMVGKDLSLLRSIPTRLRGRAGVLRVPVKNLSSPMFSGDQQGFWRSIGVTQAEIDQGYIPFRDGATFDDGSGFSLPDGADEVLAESLQAGGSTLRLQNYIGRNLSIGDRFSILASLYEVEENDDGRIVFSPPLRKAVPSGTAVRLSEPHIDVRLASADDWAVMVNLGRHSEILTVNVVEAFER